VIKVDRRQFVSAAVVAVSGVACAGLTSCTQTAPYAPASAGPVDVGPLSEVARSGSDVNGSFVRRGHFLLVNERGRLYALSSICTHRGCDVKPSPRGPAPLQCPCHDSVFTLEGKPVSGPAKRPLQRLAIVVIANGHVIVDPSRRFGPQEWENPDAYIVTS
jgi:cytochrome b6-f complex iron-sulfur subunit